MAKMADRPYMHGVPENGFRWTEGPFVPDCRGSIKTRAALVAEPGAMRPIELPRDLFLQFVKIDPKSKDQIAAFASNYGALGGAQDLYPTTAPEEAVRGELQSEWAYQIDQLRHAAELYTLIKEKDSGALARIVHLADGGRIEYSKERKRETVLLPASSRALGKHEIVLQARILLQRWINLELDQFVKYCVMWTGQFQKLIETITPVGVAGAMWMQFARAACDECSFTNCAGCGEAMLVTPEGDRPQKKVCSDKCRMRVYERRKAEARRLHAAGMRASEIAANLTADVEDVRGWIKKVKPGQKQQERSKGIRQK